jgi:threonyl-tRNA synthetase
VAETKDLEDEEVFKHYETQFIHKCEELLNEIQTTFKNFGFTEKHIDYHSGLITKEELEQYIYDTLLNLDEYKRHDLNQMHKMLSTVNCGYQDYEIGQIVHEQLIKIWFPKE